MGSACQYKVYGKGIQTVKEENKFMYWQPELGIMERSLLQECYSENICFRHYSGVGEMRPRVLPNSCVSSLVAGVFVELEKLFS